MKRKWKPNIETHEVRNRCGSPKTCASFTAQRASLWWTLKDTESFQPKSHPRFTTRFMPLCFQNSITGEKRLRSCSRGSTCDWPYQSPLVMLSAEARKRAPRRLPPCFTVKYALMAIFDSSILDIHHRWSSLPNTASSWTLVKAGWCNFCPSACRSPKMIPIVTGTSPWSRDSGGANLLKGRREHVYGAWDILSFV